MKAADRAWVTLACGVAAYEVAALVRPDWELLSEAADRHRRNHPVATHLTVLYLAGHLLRRWPQRFDPLHRIAR